LQVGLPDSANSLSSMRPSAILFQNKRYSAYSQNSVYFRLSKEDEDKLSFVASLCPSRISWQYNWLQNPSDIVEII